MRLNWRVQSSGLKLAQVAVALAMVPVLYAVTRRAAAWRAWRCRRFRGRVVAASLAAG